MKKKYIYLSIFFLILITLLIYLYPPKIINISNIETTNNEKNIQKNEEEEILTSSSNTMDQVSYSSRDLKGNEYFVFADKGEIDFSNREIIFLTNVRALINLKNSKNIEIKSDYGKYNSTNFDTIFSKNVIVNYLDNKITSEYLDFSIERNSMIISKKVIFKNLENILKSDVIEIDIDTKDANIFMYNNNKKVNIKKN